MMLCASGSPPHTRGSACGKKAHWTRVSPFCTSWDGMRPGGTHQVVDGQHSGAGLQQRVFEEHPQRDRAPSESAPWPAAAPRSRPAAAAASAAARASRCPWPLGVLGLSLVLVFIRCLLARAARRGQRLWSYRQRQAAAEPRALSGCSHPARCPTGPPPGPPYLPWPLRPTPRAPCASGSFFPARDAAPPLGGSTPAIGRRRWATGGSASRGEPGKARLWRLHAGEGGGGSTLGDHWETEA